MWKQNGYFHTCKESICLRLFVKKVFSKRTSAAYRKAWKEDSYAGGPGAVSVGAGGWKSQNCLQGLCVLGGMIESCIWSLLRHNTPPKTMIFVILTASVGQEFKRGLDEFFCLRVPSYSQDTSPVTVVWRLTGAGGGSASKMVHSRD